MPAHLVQRLAVLEVDPNSNNSYSRAATVGSAPVTVAVPNSERGSTESSEHRYQNPQPARPYALLAHNSSTEFGTDVAAALDRPVSSIATKSVITVSVNDDLGRISAVLADKHLKKAPVVADYGTVVGIINRSDINRYLVSTFVAPVPSA